MNSLDEKFKKAIDEIKNVFTVAQSMAKNEFSVSEENTRLQSELEKIKKAYQQYFGVSKGRYYYHDLICSADRRKPIGCEGCTCEIGHELKHLRIKNKKLRELFGNNEPWSLLICIKQLVLSADHLLKDHNCDGDGYEKTEIAKRMARKHIAKIEQALKDK